MKKTLLLCFIHGFKVRATCDFRSPCLFSLRPKKATIVLGTNLHFTSNQGGEETFGNKYAFTQDLRERLSTLLPKLDIQVLVYPKYETRGDLADCVSRFRDWLQEKVIDIEVAKGTPSPTIDPSVRVVLCGHSMGGIVAAETVIALTSDRVIPASSSSPSSSFSGPAGVGGFGAGGSNDGNGTAAPAENDKTPLNTLMFPYVQAVLSFDTPYFGISPGVVAHGAETHYSTATAALTQLSSLTSLWNPGTKAGTTDNTNNNNNKNNNQGQTEKQALPATVPPAAQAAEAASQATSGGGGNGGGKATAAAAAASASTWGSWGRMALYAGAGAALAGGAAAAYLKRDQLTEGWTWVSSHLEFVGCLARGEELRRRVTYMVRASKEVGVGFGNLYTRLGKGATARQQQVAGLGGTNMVGTVLGSQRTFCNLPSKRGGPDRSGTWEEAINEMAGDEASAHMSK